MEHEDRDTRLRRIITQCYTRRWITESPNGGILGLPTTICMIAIGILFAIVGAIAISRGSVLNGLIFVILPVLVCPLDVRSRARTLRAARTALHVNKPVNRDKAISDLDVSMIMSPWVSFAMRIVFAFVQVYVLVSTTAVPSSSIKYPWLVLLLLGACLLSPVATRFWCYRQAMLRVHSGRCIFCEFAVQPDLATPVPLNAAYSSARCSDCGHFVPIVVVPTAVQKEIART